MIRDLEIFATITYAAVVVGLVVFLLGLLARSLRPRRHRSGVMCLRASEVPGCIRESARCVFNAHGMGVVDKRGELITDERFEGLLREIGNNSAQGLYSVDLALEDE